MQGHAVADVSAHRPDNRGESRHRHHRTDAERTDVSHSSDACWKGQRGQHAEEMRAAGHAMQDAEAERCVRMAEPASPCWPGLNVEMVMRHGAMSMCPWRDTRAAPECPQPDAN